MKTNLLRIVAIVGVLILASLTTGCLKASVSATYSAQNIVVQKDTKLEGVFTFKLAGLLGGGQYNRVKVEWLNATGGKISPASGERTEYDINVTLIPYKDFREGSLDLAEVNDGAGIIPSANCFGDLDELVVRKVRFTFSFLGLGLSPVTVDVPVAID